MFFESLTIYLANKSSIITSLLTILLPIPLATPKVVTNVCTSDFVVLVFLGKKTEIIGDAVLNIFISRNAFPTSPRC